MINDRIIYLSIILSGLVVILLAFFPEWDIAFSGLFYEYDKGFIYRDNFIVQLFFLAIPSTTWIFIITSFILLVREYNKQKSCKKTLSSPIVYLMVALIIGPGFAVNYFLKDVVGRARPSQIIEFGGIHNFTPTLLPADECNRNCSLPSGHAAMAYYYTSLAYGLILTHKKKNLFKITYISAILFGTITGLSRVIMGGHFLSDIILSCFIILTINHLLYLCWKKISQ